MAVARTCTAASGRRGAPPRGTPIARRRRAPARAPRASPCAETALTGAVDAQYEVARSGEKWGSTEPADPPADPASPPPPAARAACPHRTRRPRPQRQGRPDRCSPASTGTRWTTRDGSPSLSKFRAQLDAGLVVSRWLDDCLAIHTKAGWEELSDQGRRAPIHRPDRAPLPAVRLRRARTEAELDKQGRILLPGLPARVDRPRRRGRGRRVTRPRGDLGTRPVGRLPEGARRPTGAGQGLRRPGDLARHHMRFQDPLGIRFVRDGGEMNEGHLPVLVEEVIEMLAPAPGSLHIDATLGGGGHTERILEAANPDGRLLGLDADPAADRPGRRRGSGRASAIGSSSARRTSATSRPSRPRRASAPSTAACSTSGCRASSWPTRDRGFGFRAGGPLDMRFDTSRGVPAAELLATLDAAELTALFRRYGEEPKAPRIARAIVEARRVAPDHDRRGAGRARRAGGAAEPAPAAPDASRDARLPGAADRGQRGARGAPGRPGRRARPAPAGRPARRPELPLARGPDRQAVLPGGASRLRLPARAAGLRLRPEPAAAPGDQPVADADRRPRSPPTPELGAPDCGPPSASPPITDDPCADRGRPAADGGGPHEQAPPVQPSQDLRTPPARGPRAARSRPAHARASSSSSASWGAAGQADPFGFLDPRTPRIRFALGD